MKIIPACIAIVGIVVIEAIALARGIDGALFGLVIAALAGLGGYEVKNLKDIFRRKKGG